MTPEEADKLVASMMNLEAGNLADEYRDELSYRFAQEVRLRVDDQYGSLRKFAEEKGLDAAQLSRQLNGTFNLTLKSIARIAAALEEPLMNVCGRPSYRFEQKGLPLYAITAKQQRVSDPYESKPRSDSSLEPREFFLHSSGVNISSDAWPTSLENKQLQYNKHDDQTIGLIAA